MKNTINYYYNLNPNKINRLFNYYYFYINNELYYLKIYEPTIKNNQILINFNQELIKQNILINEIILNNYGKIITIINQIPYILMKINININKEITLEEISYLSTTKISYPKELMRDNWTNLWTKKIDYLEYYQQQNYQKYPLISNSFNYFIGLSENAISYLNITINTLKKEIVDIGVLSHNKITIDDTIYTLYDPTNIIIDHKSRDLAEYIKISFFKDNYNIFEELDKYFKYHYYSFYGIQLIISRILWPSFYFEIIDAIIKEQENEASILKITSRLNEYEIYLKEIFNYFKKYYPIKEIPWIINKK